MYVPLMADAIERLKKDDLTQSKQYIKLNSLYDLLNGKNRRLGYLLITEMVCVYSQQQQPLMYTNLMLLVISCFFLISQDTFVNTRRV